MAGVDHDTLVAWLTRLQLTAIRDQLDNLLDEAAEKKLTLREASPGVTPRPSLSAGTRRQADARRQVSPGVTPRPSLSGQDCAGRRRRPPVSPGVTPRPSLSESGW